MPDVLAALSSLFAVADDVFMEHDAFDRPNVTIGRLYREWKKTREALGEPVPHTADRTEPQVTVLLDSYGRIAGVYSDARDAGYALKRLDFGARAETVILR